jgi:5,10-methylenetetrahydrofolate reductase
MNINFELNPPKIVKDEHFDAVTLREGIQHLVERAGKLVGYVNGIHLTDSVLGIPRVSSLTAASFIIKNIARHPAISCSVRTRDRNFTSICQFVSDAILLGVDSLLFLMGDEPSDGPKDSGLKPSDALNMLKLERYNESINLDLTVPSAIIHPSSIRKKINAQPRAFVTQSISSLSNLDNIAQIAKSNNIKVVACIMIPAEKNKFSADTIGLNWEEYAKNPVDFVLQAAKIADEVTLTSPGSFKVGLEFLKQLH